MSILENTVTVTLLGKSYTIKCSADKAEALTKAETFLNQKLEATRAHTPSSNPTDLALIVALNLSDELLCRNEAPPPYQAALDEQVTQLQNKIQQQLNKTPQQSSLPEVTADTT